MLYFKFASVNHRFCIEYTEISMLGNVCQLALQFLFLTLFFFRPSFLVSLSFSECNYFVSMKLEKKNISNL